MVYPIRVCARRGPLGSGGDTYIRLYDENLVYISEWQFSTSGRYVSNFAIDDDGNIYLDYNGLNYLLKYNNAGAWQASANLTYPLNGISMDKYGYINALVVVNANQSRIYKRLLTDLTPVSSLNLTYAYQYGGLVFDQDDGDILYVGNASSVKVEKWNWTGGKLAEKSLTTSTKCLALVGNVLAGSLTSKLWRVSKDLSGAVVDYEIESDGVTGVISGVSNVWISGIEDSYFLVTFCATSSDPVKASTWYLRKYSTSFVQIGTTIELLPESNNFYTPGAKGPYDMLIPPVATNVKAELNSVFARVLLYGELTGGDPAIERGFEYLIQDAEPGAGDSGTEVKETDVGGFAVGEFSLRNKVLYDLTADVVWWFRTYSKIEGSEEKYPASSWMKNLPTVTTQAMTNVNYNKADGNSNVTDEGASELTKRGFEVSYEFSGRLPDSWKFKIAGFEGELESETSEDAGGVIIDFYWAGTLIKTVFEIAGLAVGAFVITVGEMEFGWPVVDNCLIESKDYTCRAFADNEFGRVYGEEVIFSTLARAYLSEDSPTVGEISIIKNETIENLPGGITASRRGFRYGTTEAADEFDVHENGSFTNGPYSMMLQDLLPDTTYYIVGYIVVNGIIHEGTMETITTDLEGTEDEDEYPTPHFSPHGQDYREMSTKVFAEVLASIGIIGFSGGKKTLPITNHLIQANSNAKTIADNYLNRFKLAKTRMSISFPTPLPFEREDTVDFGYGTLLFKEDDEGVVHFKEDGAGASVLMDQISMIIKKINNVGLIKTSESIEYVADLDLEHE